MAKNDFLKLEVKSSNKYIKVSGNKIELNKTFAAKLSDKGLYKNDEKQIAKMVRDKISSNIIKGKRYDTGGNVAALKPSTIKRKGFSKPLQDTGKLALGVMVDTTGDHPIVRMKDQTYKGGAKLQMVAAANNNGTDKIPARPFFGINKKDATIIVNSVLKDKFKK